MRTHRTFSAVILLLAAAGALDAQPPRSRAATPDLDRDDERRPRRSFAFSTFDADRPWLGISLGAASARDTMGVAVEDVTPDGPAAQAGLMAGDYITAIDGVKLKVAREDADDPEMAGIGMRRLTRELGKRSPGDTVELTIWRDGRSRTLKVKTTSARTMLATRGAGVGRRDERDGRAALGIGLGTSGSKRDTLGVLVSSLTDDGPAAKAGLEEGDRIAAINGVDLRVPPEDAGDWETSSARIRRLTRELDRLKAGDEVELRLYRGGTTRTVKVRTIAHRDLPARRGAMLYFGDADRAMLDGLPMIAPVPPTPPRPPAPPGSPEGDAPPAPPHPPRAPRMYYFDGNGREEIRLHMEPEIRERMDAALRRALELQRVRPRMRQHIDGGPARSHGRSVVV